MIGQAATFSIFRKWRDESPPTKLRVDMELGVMQLSLECSVTRVDVPLVGFRISGGFGFVEFIFDESWGFDFMALDAARLRLEQRVGESPLKDRRLEFGEIVAGTRPTAGATAIFAEIVREVGS